MTEAGKLRQKTFALSFLFSLPFGLLLYFNSSFLHSKGLSEQEVALALSAGYVLCFLITLLLPYLLRAFGDRRLFSYGLALTALLYSGVFFSGSAAIVAILLPLALGISTSLYVLLDIFLTTATGDTGKTGGRRGIFATLRNGAYIVAQLLAVIGLGHFSYWYLYGAAALAFLVLAFLSAQLLKEFRDPAYDRPDWSGTLRTLMASRCLRGAFLVQFSLRVFYAVMIVYTPLYLHDHIGIPYEYLGLIFAFMIVPFLLLEIPIGRLEDRRWGEKEVIVAGLLVTGVATALLSFIVSASVAIWALALFATRIGAALLDIGSETYFFKQVRGQDSGEVSAFRLLFPFSYIMGPLVGAVFLVFLPLKWIFLALGIFLLLSILPSLALKDTR